LTILTLILGLGETYVGRVLDRFDMLERLNKVTIEELKTVKGVSENVATSIFLAFHHKFRPEALRKG
jgi:excinuclease UvrABC nuclease subunit